MLDLDPDDLRQYGIFHPYAFNKVSAAIADGTRFVHYTSAAVAASIIENASVWMRKSSVMNDFAEIEHGFECLQNAYGGESGEEFNHSLMECFPASKQSWRTS